MGILTAIGLTFMLGLGGDPQARLVLDVTSAHEGGRIMIAVHDRAETLRRGRDPVRTLSVPRTGAVTPVIIEDLRPGRYAVAVFHDLDGDGRLSTWPIGLPKEPYGFSRDARGRFGPPDFADAAVDLSVGTTRHGLTLK